MEDIRRDVLVVTREVAAGRLLDHDEARCVRCADDAMGVVHAGAGIEIEVVAADEDGAVGAVV